MAYGEPTSDAEGAPKKKPTPPDDFESAEDFLKYVRECVSQDLSYDKHNADAGISDAKFLVGDQWDSVARARRVDAQKPILSENYLPAFIGQVTGNRRLNEADIKVLPDNGGTKPIAAVREGLIRNIQKNSVAKVAYDTAFLNQVVTGIGNFQVCLKYAYDDVFDQDIDIESIVNAFAVIWDRMSVEPTGRDAKRCTVIDKLARSDFEKEYPDATPSDVTADSNLMAELTAGGWFAESNVQIATFWRIRTRKRTLALFVDGSVKEVDKTTDLSQIVQDLKTGAPIMREAIGKYAERYLVSGLDILEGPYRLPISRIPVFRVPGWELNVGEMRHRWSIIRFMKDSQRLHNYWRSVLAEKYTQSPKAVWTARASAVQGREKMWRESHKSDDTLLIYNDEAAEAPARTPPTQIELALIQEGATSLQAMRDISNIHEASLGQQSNEVSGKAIVARQRVGELGSVLYQDNLNLAIAECGRVINELIPAVYSTPRIVKILGPDDKAALIAINKDANSDISIGKYSVTVTTGPSYVTRRVESSESMLNFVNAVPQSAALVGDLVAEAQDWPKSDEFARRLRAALPPGMLAQDDMTDEQKQNMEAQAQAQAQTAQLAQAMAQATLAKAQAEVEEVQAKTRLLDAQAARQTAQPKIDAAKAHSAAVSTQLNDTLETIKVAHEGDKANVKGK